MPITGPLARAARALVEWPRDHVAQLSQLGERELADFESGASDPGEAARQRLKGALESGGAVFLPENGELGIGVCLKFTAKDVRAINRMEGEGGNVGDDDV